MRIGIVGGGLAGAATAWLLDPVHDIFLFEARPRVGGHADSLRVSMPDGRVVIVDIGAQYTSWEGFPAHGRLMRLAGMEQDALTPAPVTMTIAEGGCRTPLVVTPHGPDERAGRRLAVTGAAYDAIGTFLQAAVAFQAADADWTLPLSDLVEPLPLSRGTKDGLIYPWISHIVCCAAREAPAVSARGAIAFFARLAPPAADEAVVWANPTPGMQALVERLAAQLPDGRVRCGAAIDRIERSGDGFTLSDVRGGALEVDRVVLAAPPWEALPLLAALPGTQAARLALAQFTCTPAVVAVHRDPAYMPADRRHWSTVCLDLHDGWCEASHWYGPVHGVDLFKSWITFRRDPPEHVVARRAFRHLVVTPAAVRAREGLGAMQGEAGVYFTGSYMTGIDTQDSAVLSAAAVAGHLAPHSARLAQLAARPAPAGAEAAAPGRIAP